MTEMTDVQFQLHTTNPLVVEKIKILIRNLPENERKEVMIEEHIRTEWQLKEVKKVKLND